MDGIAGQKAAGGPVEGERNEQTGPLTGDGGQGVNFVQVVWTAQIWIADSSAVRPDQHGMT